MRKSSMVLALIAGSAVSVALAATSPFDTKSSGVINVAVFGDSPYGVDAPFGGKTTDTSELQATPAFIDSINADPSISFVLHVGDIHSGKQYCTQGYDTTIYSLWAGFQHPLVYTPGDNEWTDCHKVGEGGGAYNANLQQIVYDTDANGNQI